MLSPQRSLMIIQLRWLGMIVLVCGFISMIPWWIAGTDATFWFWHGIPDDSVPSLHKWFIGFHQHPWRIPFELGIWICGCQLLRIIWVNHSVLGRIWLFIGICIFALSSFLFLYYFAYHRIYGCSPYLKNDWNLVQEVLPLFIKSISTRGIVSILLMLLLGLVYLFFGIYCIRSFFKQTCNLPVGPFPTLFSLGILVYMFSAQTIYQRTSYQMKNKLVQSSLAISHDILIKVQSKRSQLDITKMNVYHHLPQLKTKPDIHCIFLEAYGSVCYLREDIASLLKTDIQNIADSIQQAGYQIASLYTSSPVKGGKSWLAYSTALTGMKIEEQITFNAITKKQLPYPHLPRLFQSQGYATIGMSTMYSDGSLGQSLTQKQQDAFWSYQKWYLYPDFQYNSLIHDWYGGLHDQYAYGYYRDLIRPSFQQPIFQFFITTSTHYPYFLPPPIFSDWKEMSHYSITADQEEKWLDQNGMSKRYSTSIRYSLQSLNWFLQSQQDTNAIFIILGDHQPATLDYSGPLKYQVSTTPIHLITRNRTFYQHCIQEGFHDGWIPPIDEKRIIQHESLYSRFIRLIWSTYSDPSFDKDKYPILEYGVAPSQELN